MNRAGARANSEGLALEEHGGHLAGRKAGCVGAGAGGLVEGSTHG